MPNESNGWSAYEKHVLAELSALKDGQVALRQAQAEANEQLVLVRIDVAMLKVKSGLWGAVGAAIVTSAAGLIATATGIL